MTTHIPDINMLLAHAREGQNKFKLQIKTAAAAITLQSSYAPFS